MTYREALIITRDFQSQHYRLTGRPTEETLRRYAEAALFLRNR